MTDYTITTDFGAKDSLPSGNAAKIIKGSEFTTEFTNIKTAVNSKADSVSPTFTGNTALNGTTTFGPDGTSTFNGTVNFTKDVTFDTNTMFVDVSENRVGMGTTSPASTLDVNGTVTIGGDGSSINFTGTSGSNFITAKQGLKVDIDSDVNQGGTLFSVTSNNGANNVFNVKEDGDASFYDTAGTNVKLFWDASAESLGIGTTAPSSLLHLESASAPTLKINDTDSTLALELSQDGSNGSMLLKSAGTLTIGVTNNSSSDVLSFQTQSTERMRIDSSGNVGIGTSNPSRVLHVKGSNDTVRLESTGSNTKIEMVNTGSTTNEFGFLSNNFFVAPDGSEKMRINASGNVGIGTTSPSYPLDVDGLIASRDAYLITANSSGTPSAGAFMFRPASNTLALGTDSTERMRIDASGDLMVATTSEYAFNGGFSVKTGTVPFINVGHASSVASGNYYAAFHHGTNTIGTITQSNTTGVSYNTSSDERLKENITDSADAGSKVDAIQIRQFDWIADGLHQDYGVIAQELVTVAPEAVHQPEDSEDMMGVDYSKLVPMLIKEVQTLRNRVAQLENN